MSDYLYCAHPTCPSQGKPFHKSLEVDDFGIGLCPWCNRDTTKWVRGSVLRHFSEFTVVTDGSCPKNDGKNSGGWGAIVLQHQSPLLDTMPVDPAQILEELSGQETPTTNNRMEMMALIRALEALPEGSSVHVVADSLYVINGASNWAHTWAITGWVNSSGAVKNVDLWKRILALLPKYQVTWQHVRGHRGHPWNERCDKLARCAADGKVWSP